MPPSSIAIVDANAFYCSCFAAFDAKLRGRPIIVLSNNDGNVIARNQPAKALGIAMGAPYFEVKTLLAAHNVAVFSSNHGFFAEMAARFQSLLYDYSPLIEHYSIDEAWVDLQATPRLSLTDIGRELHQRIFRLSGVPVSVGIAETKTLAKVALEFAKVSPKTKGVLDLTRSPHQQAALERLPVGEVWGIGPRRAELLQRHAILSAWALREADERWIRQQLTIVGLRTVQELRGITCFPINPQPPQRQQVTCSRAFGSATDSLADVRAAVAAFTGIAAAKLRRDGLLAGKLTVWLSTDSQRPDQPQYQNSRTISLAPLSNCTLELGHLALNVIEQLYRPGFRFRRAGVSLTELLPENEAPRRLWEDERYLGLRRLMAALDYCNARFGRETVRCGYFPSSLRWQTKALFAAPGRTTRWADVPIFH